jgi:hypothetical protein
MKAVNNDIHRDTNTNTTTTTTNDVDNIYGNELLFLPILFGIFVLFLIYCYLRKSMRDTNDAYWCCCHRCRLHLRLQQHNRTSSSAAAAAAVTMVATITVEIREQQRQRDIQQRQLPLQASVHHQERELHQFQLENNVRLEKKSEPINKRNRNTTIYTSSL